MDGTDVLVGSSVSSYWCCSGSQSWEEYSSPGIPVFQGHLQLGAPEPWCTTRAGWTRCCAHQRVSFQTQAQGMAQLYGFQSQWLSTLLSWYPPEPLWASIPPPPRQVCVFGICDTSHTLARGVMRIVSDRSAAYNTATYSQWDNCSQRWMGSIQPRPTPTICWTA